MSLSLWMLFCFAGWTLAIMMVGVGIHRWALILTRRAELVSFPGDMPHGSRAYRRVVRAHANCIENLPVFAVLVMIAAITRLSTPGFDHFSVLVMAMRITQSTIHMSFTETNLTVGLRFSAFLIQLLAMTGMGFLLAAAALP